MTYVNRAVTFFFDLLLSPFSNMPPLVGLMFLSVLTGVLMLVIFKKTSNQKKIGAARNRMQGRLLEMRLFQADPGAVLRAAGAMLVQNVAYLRYMFAPMLVMIVPVVLVLIQANARYGVRPAAPGEDVLVTVRLQDNAPAAKLDSLSLTAARGARIETPAARAPELKETAWRVSADKQGVYTLTLSARDETMDKNLAAGAAAPRPVWTVRPGRGFFQAAFNPGEPPLSDPDIAEIHVHYPPRNISLAGHTVHWLIIFFVVSLIAAFALKGIFRVEF